MLNLSFLRQRLYQYVVLDKMLYSLRKKAKGIMPILSSDPYENGLAFDALQIQETA